MRMAKPSTLEDEYFVREDAERIRQLHFEEMRRLKEHYHCLNCGGAFLPRGSWERLHKATEPHGLQAVVDAVLNWFRPAAYKP